MGLTEGYDAARVWAINRVQARYTRNQIALGMGRQHSQSEPVLQEFREKGLVKGFPYAVEAYRAQMPYWFCPEEGRSKYWVYPWLVAETVAFIGILALNGAGIEFVNKLFFHGNPWLGSNAENVDKNVPINLES